MSLHYPSPCVGLLLLAITSGIDGFLPGSWDAHAWTHKASPAASSPLFVSIGLGPDEKEVQEKEMVAGVDYEIPNHEEYRLSQRSKFDEKCDEWYGKLLGTDNGILGSLAEDARQILNTPVPLENDVS
jgi:hypothetical protein